MARGHAEGPATNARTRFRRMKLAAGERPADRAPERVAPVARAGARPLGEASANSAEVALRFQFKRRGWALRSRAQAQCARA